MKKSWYAVFTKAHCEKKVAALLSKKRIENYCPFNKIDSSQAHRKRTGLEPVFPGFIFVFISDTEMSYIRQTMEMVSFIYWLGKPAMIKDIEIDKMKYFNSEFSNITVLKTPVNMSEQAWIVEEEHTADTEAAYLPLQNNTIKLSLPSLGYTLVTQAKATRAIAYKFEQAKAAIDLLTTNENI